MYARTPRDLGLIIKERRRKLGLAQQDVAKRAGVSRQWVVEVERGKQRAEVGLLLKTLTELGLAVDVREFDAKDLPGASSQTPDIDAIVRAARRARK